MRTHRSARHCHRDVLERYDSTGFLLYQKYRYKRKLACYNNKRIAKNAKPLPYFVFKRSLCIFNGESVQHFPKRYTLIEFQENAYLADLEYHRLLPVDELVRDVFERLESETEVIVSDLADKYTAAEIRNCLQYLHWPQVESFSKTLEAPARKIFAPRVHSTHGELRWNTLGASVAHIELLKALSKYATIHVTQEFEDMENMVLMPFNIQENASVSRMIKENYDGVLLWYLDEVEMMSGLNYLHVPVVLPIYAARGDNGRILNRMMNWYASLRNFDAFLTLSQPTIDLYSTFIHDTSLFHIVPCGVDTEFFQPEDKGQAKQKVSELLGRPEMTEKPVVGYISRFEVEKGAGVFMDIARLMPEVLFVAAGPIEESHHYDFPENVVHSGRHPREELPVLYNAFDVFCFPSLACSEEFGLVVLEAMACGTVPVVSSYDGPKYVVKDAGVVVPAMLYDRDMTSLGGGIFAEDFAQAIAELLQDDAGRQKLAEKARQRALELTWDNSAKCLLQVFDELNAKKHLARQRNLPPIGFSFNEGIGKSAKPKATIINTFSGGNVPLTGSLYDTSVEEGIALSLLQNHSMHEIEVILSALLADDDAVAEHLDRLKGFMRALF